MSLPPHAEIGEHRDAWHGLQTGLVRLNLILQQPAGTVIRLNGEEQTWEEGELWWADFSRPHSVVNGNGVRLNMILDVELDRRLLRRFPASLRSSAYCVPKIRATDLNRFAGVLRVPRQLEHVFGGCGVATVSPTGEGLTLAFKGRPAALLLSAGDGAFRVLGCAPATQLLFATPERNACCLRLCTADGLSWIPMAWHGTGQASGKGEKKNI